VYKLWNLLKLYLKVKTMTHSIPPIPPVNSFDALIQGVYALVATTVGSTAVPVAKYVLQLHEWLLKKAGKSNGEENTNPK